MASKPPSAVDFCHFKNTAWAWITVLLYLSSFVHSLAYWTVSSDQPPRTALGTLAHHPDLSGLLDSFNRLGDELEDRHHSHWVFFGPRDLGEALKRSAWNAINVTLVYEVVPGEHWIAPHWIDRHRLHATLVDGPTPDWRQSYRRNTGSFAKERIPYHGWVLKTESGAQLTGDIDLDVFWFMRDNGPVYAFDKAVLDEAKLRNLSPRLRSLINKYPGLVREASISRLLDTSDSTKFLLVAADNVEKRPARDDNKNNNMETLQIIWEELPSRLSLSRADQKQDTDRDSDDHHTISALLADAFTSWLSGIYESSIIATFEIGSFAFFRSPSHLAFFDHVDSALEFYSKGVEVPFHTVSVGMILPRQSVWDARKKGRPGQHFFRHPSLPEQTPNPEFDLPDVEADWSNSMTWTTASNVRMAMNSLLTQWEWMSRDMGRQEGGLMAGCTTIDERNFAIMGLCILPETI